MLYLYGWILVQILLENFPISSSGHVQLLKVITHHFGITTMGAFNAKALEIFDHFLHGPTLLILACFFFKRWFFLLKNVKRCVPIIVKIIGFVAIADVITVGWYYFFKYTQVQHYFSLGLGFAITGFLLCMTYFLPERKSGRLSFKSACVLGLVQGIAFLPGISRLASTFFVARYLGLDRHKAFELSWLLAFPLMAAAFAHSVLLHNASIVHMLTSTTSMLIIVATLLAYPLFYLSAHLAYKNRWWIFGVYMIIPLVVWLLL